MALAAGARKRVIERHEGPCVLRLAVQVEKRESSLLLFVVKLPEEFHGSGAVPGIVIVRVSEDFHFHLSFIFNRLRPTNMLRRSRHSLIVATAHSEEYNAVRPRPPR
jgi:hypothetical protein